MSSPAAADKKAIRLARPPKGFVPFMAWVIHALQRLAAAAGFSLQIAGASRASVNANGGFEIATTGSTTTPSSEIAFTVRANYSIVPGLVNTTMPTIGGVRLDHSTPPTLSGIPSSGVRYVFFKLTFSTAFSGAGFLTSSPGLSTVEVEVSSSSSPTNTASVKYLLFTTITNGVPSNTYVNRSPLPVTLWDNGVNATTLRVGNL